MMFFILTSTFIVIPPLNYITFVPSRLHLHSHEICFVNVFDSFITVIRLKRLRFKFFPLFGTFALLDKSLNSVTTSNTSSI